MIDAARIAAWLPQARWFAGKGAALARVAIRDEAIIPSTGISLTLLDAATADATDRYVAPLADDADAALDQRFAAWLVEAIRAGGAIAGRHGVFRGRPAAPVAPAPPGEAVRVSSLGNDASNTSLLVERAGGSLAVKLLRRCRPGVQPEVEVGEFFARHAPWAATPRFLGWLEYAPAAGDAIAVATVHEFAPGCTTAWDHLVPLVAGGGLSGPDREQILGVTAALGRTTAEMHRTLASRPDIAAFAPEEASAADRQAEAERMLGHATHVFSLAEARLPSLPPAVATATERLLARRDAITAALGRLPASEPWGALIRIHGDYHLGQVLVRPQGPDVLVIDFEGEPGRSLADRRRKTTAAKDVAGMCRSFDYLLRHAARVGSAAYDAAHLRMLEASYLEAYRGVAAGQPWWPAEPRAADALLAIYKLDKALYELAYELQNRPDWVEVPLAALLAEDRL